MFCPGVIRTLVAIATYIFHRLIIEKMYIGDLGIFGFVITEIFIE